jgi:DNA-binding response OmpR family regulator
LRALISNPQIKKIIETFREEAMTKILIVDDDIQVTKLLARVLSAEGYETIAVNDSSKAIEVAVSTNPDLVILDLMMPQPDGFKVCRMLREDQNFMYTPILIVTALDDSDSRIVAFGAGANDYLTKPFNLDELISLTKALIDESL